MKLYEDEEKKELRKMAEYYKESHKLLTNHEWMEKVVVRTFLRICGVKFKDDDLKKGSEPPDVVFREANFEVTEVQDEGRRRGDENRERIDRNENVKCLSDLFEPYISPSSMDFSQLIKNVERGMDIKHRKKKYQNPETCKNLDLLVYVDLNKRYLALETKIDCSSEFLSKVRKQGWRSVSFLMGLCAGVIFADEHMPDLFKKLQVVIKTTDNPDIYKDR